MYNSQMRQVAEAQSKSYNQIVKAFGLFGGVQVFKIFISIIRAKFVAILLGTAGIGILGLLSSTIVLISSITNLGINSSAVITISKAANDKDKSLINRSIIILRRWVGFTGILGAGLTLIFASKLSQWVFSSDDYKWAFVWLSLTLLFQAVSNGQLAVFQGLRKLKHLAKANVIGAILGLCISLTLYYFYGIDGIVPSLILTAASALLISWYFAKKIKVESVEISLSETYRGGFEMARLGGVFVTTNLFGAGVMYLIQIFINKFGGVDQVGLYGSAFGIINGYFGLIFTAMSTDLFPRLASISKDNVELGKLINQQSEILLLIVTPLLIFIMSFLPIVIRILLTEKFLPIIPLMRWALLGVFFQAVCYPFGLTVAAKGFYKSYFIIVMTLHATTLLAYMVSYYYLKLEGIGIACLLVNASIMFFHFRFAQVKYEFSYEKPLIKVFGFTLTLNIVVFLFVMFGGSPFAYFTGLILMSISTLYSYHELKKRLDFSAIIQKIKDRKK